VFALVVIATTVAALGAIYVMGRMWARAGTRVPAEELRPFATFDGGDRYVSDDERTRVDASGPSGAGEGMLAALVEILRVRGVAVNPIEPEDYGFMTVIELAGEDIILKIGASGDTDWMLFVKTPDGRVPLQITDALASLADVRNITWELRD
jgi:hypothetical protein